MVTVSEDSFFKLSSFHLRGKHVQHSHGKNSLLSKVYSGAMIALMPSVEDAERLRIGGGEITGDLHLTLYYLGKAVDWKDRERESVINTLIGLLSSKGLTSVSGRAFGVAHWNGNGDDPCWVLNISDIPDDEQNDSHQGLEQIRGLIARCLEDYDIPLQHTPWIPHVCLAYTRDLSLIEELENRLGVITFDRIRVAFGDEFTDIQLTPNYLTAAAHPLLRRNFNDFELRAKTDFVRMQEDWQSSVDSVLEQIQSLRDSQRETLVNRIFQAAETNDLNMLTSITLDDEQISSVLLDHMMKAAMEAGRAQEEEAESQGVEVPEWSLEGALTAAVGVELLSSIARVTARVINTSFIQSAIRRALTLIGRPQVSPEQVAENVDQHLSSLSEASVRESVGGAITAAQNEGRRIVLNVAPEASRYVSSEILDRNVCGPCREIDGREFDSLPDALEQYPAGGYRDCLGGVRCRGTIIAVWDEEDS